jgi:response regulator NasT
LQSALIISPTEKSVAYLIEILAAASVTETIAVTSCEEAHRLLQQQDFDLVVINTPLKDESGERFSRYIAAKGPAQVILLAAGEYFDNISNLCENDGVFVIEKPIDKRIFLSALKLARAAQNKLTYLRAENIRLKRQIEDIRIIDRAKCLLITYLNITEQAAHRHIEKQAMDMRVPKRDVAEGILKTYEN